MIVSVSVCAYVPRRPFMASAACVAGMACEIARTAITTRTARTVANSQLQNSRKRASE